MDTAAVTGGEVWVAEGSYSDSPDTHGGGGLVLPTYVSLYGGFAGSETTREQRDWARHPTFLAPRARTPGGRYFITAAAGQWVSAVDGFVITGGGADAGPGAISCVGASPLIRNNVFSGWYPASTALLWASMSSPVIYNNAFAGNGIRATGLLALVSGAASVQNNLFVGNAAYGVAGGEGLLKCVSSSARVSNNLFDGNATRADSAFLIAQKTALAVTNNTFVNNQGGGFVSMWTATTVFVNNTAAFNSVGKALPLPSTPTVHNNVLYQSGPLAPPVGGGNIEAYPGFADLFHGDFRPTAGSPTVDAGDDGAVEHGEVDLDGHPRIRGAHVDIGAYEFSGSGIPGLDPGEALKIAGGLEVLSPEGLDWLAASGQTRGLSITDAVALLKALSNSADR
jgi:hypothetical protein